MAIDRNAPNDVSDIRPDSVTNPDVSPTKLPIRGEKRIIPKQINPGDISSQLQNAWNAGGSKSPNQKGYASGRTALVETSDFYTKAALEPFVDYVLVRLPHRNGALPAVYRFLINPAQVQIQRTTLDGQAMTRAGWQIGVWGEDMIQISLVGKTVGQYFAFGLTDKYEQFSESYRNLEQLQVVFENNGYWFEGEQAAEGPLAADFARRRIKMHEDVELIVGNFMWYGMFDSLTLQESAEAPFLTNFNITFTAWKERFRSGSPYDNQLKNDLQRGHSYTAWAATPISAAEGIPSIAAQPSRFLPPDAPSPLVPPVVVPPAVTAAQAENTLPQGVGTTAVDSSPTANVLHRQQFINYWNGVI